MKQISVLLTDRGYLTYCARRDARRSLGRSPGRNYTEVVDTIREFMRRGVIIKTVINGMTFNGSTTNPKQIRLGSRSKPSSFMKGIVLVQLPS